MQQQLLNQHYQQLQKQAILQQIQVSIAAIYLSIQYKIFHLKLFLFNLQQQQQLQQEQRQKAAESALLNLSSNSSSFSAVASRSLLTQTHPGSPTDVTEMIWGPDPDTTQGKQLKLGIYLSWKTHVLEPLHSYVFTAL